VGNIPLCVFSIPRVFYRCPTTSVAPRSKNTCRPGRKFFHFQNHYRPCVDHATVCATLDAVHRVTVLCAVLCVLSLISGLHGVFGLCCRPCPCCATLFYHAVLIYCCVLCAVLYAVYVYPPSRRWMVGNGGQWQVPSQIGGALPIVTNRGDQTKNQRSLHEESPTKTYRNLCSRCESAWCVWLGHHAAYQPLPIDRSG
jgi:hypothetical protein